MKILLKKDISFFKQNDLFEYRLFKNDSGHSWHGAIYCANLHGNSTQAIHELPDGYTPEDWNHESSYLSNKSSQFGAVSCSNCCTRRRHFLNWPADAFYSIQVKDKILWAYNRDSTIELRDYIASHDRDIYAYNWTFFLLHIPTSFKKRNIRDTVIKKLNKILK
ncbi:hypothetical protein [Curvivirga aplysinae]|uniref:hypothetical protein n=1 Tax=Curvivirga aplysinae TaxID=2529852 RepID=UPI0012BBAB0E|nr:hypothetical protein [Curvivirga aplysinae]MTI10918.1 hypothetical protein [Curvivirga aplysinae]